MTYQPRPIPTKDVVLPDPLLDLTERLPENTHDVWARRCLTEDWTYGPHRDDAATTHPCLVPYAELPESEKDYDCGTSMETLKAILVQGYQIVPPS